MTQIYITVGIIAAVSALVCFVFIRQTISERKLERDRLKRALDKRAKELLQAISVFPDNFLPKELTVFLYRCIIDAYEQLTRLEPSEKSYIESLQIYSSQLETVVRKQEGQQVVELQNAAQIGELKQYLNLISNFLQKSMQRGQISKKQHAHYRLLLKELLVILTVNGNTISAQQAQEIGKYKLALHYYDLAKKLLIRETPEGFKEKVQRFTALMEPLQIYVDAEDAALQEQNKNPYSENNPDPEEKDEWSGFKEDEDWKKKNVYD